MEDEFDSTADAHIWDGFLPETVHALSEQELDRYAGKRVLITGAGGYLGSALASALALLPVTDLVLLDQSEYGLYRLEQDLRARGSVAFRVGNVLDRGLLEELFSRHAPNVVFHAAALKHVPLLEANPFAAVETNVIGTQLLVEVARNAGTDRLVLLSTDKAVDPSSVMGATKHIAEQVVLQPSAGAVDVRIVVRLCNVLGSTGSVAPLFVRQIEAGKALTLTHAEATRYFLSRTDAVRCLLRAGVNPMETGLFVPSLRKPRRVAELAEFLSQALSHGERQGIVIEIGLRPGEKLHEELISSADKPVHEAAGGMSRFQTTFDPDVLTESLQMIRDAVRTRNLDHLAAAIRRAVPTYSGPFTPDAVEASA